MIYLYIYYIFLFFLFTFYCLHSLVLFVGCPGVGFTGVSFVGMAQTKHQAIPSDFQKTFIYQQFSTGVQRALKIR